MGVKQSFAHDPMGQQLEQLSSAFVGCGLGLLRWAPVRDRGWAMCLSPMISRLTGFSSWWQSSVHRAFPASAPCSLKAH